MSKSEYKRFELKYPNEFCTEGGGDNKNTYRHWNKQKNVNFSYLILGPHESTQDENFWTHASQR